MFIPLHDSTPLKVIRFQMVTVGIILANTVLFITTNVVDVYIPSIFRS